MSEPTVLDWASRYLRAGISVIPIRRRGNKEPDTGRLPWIDDGKGGRKRSWKPYQKTAIDQQTAIEMWRRSDPPGIAAVGGEVSGGLELLDFDREADILYPQWQALVEEEYPGLVGRAVCSVCTPRGRHSWYRCPDLDPFPGNQKLAVLSAAEKEAERLLAEQQGRKPEYTLIETRGEGGYALVPGCPADCHPSGQTYEHAGGPPLWELPAISLNEHDCLIRCARSLTRETVEPRTPHPPGFDGPLRPGEDYDRRAPDWAEILQPHGWELAGGGTGGERRWRRPGKDRGWSATTGFCRSDGVELLRVFSSNAHPFEDGKAYGPFRALALLAFAGDYSACARSLVGRGYGTPAPQRVQPGTNGQGPTHSPPKPPPRPAPEVRPYVPFPLDSLPRPLALFAREGAAALGCDPAYLALPALAACAGAIGNSRAIRLKRTWVEPCILWTVIVGDSGTLKTPAWKMALAPLWAAEEQFRDHHQRDMEEFRDDAERHKEAMRRARAEGRDLPTEPARPVMRRAVCGDITIERLAEVLEENPRGVLVARDELAGWFGSFKRYKSQGGTDLPNWLEMHQAGAVRVDRKTGERRTLFVRRAAASITGGIQPGILTRSLTGEHFDAGLAARLLLAWPDRQPKEWTEAEVPEEVEGGYRRLLDCLLRLEMRTAERGRPDSHRLGLAPDAKRTWVRFYNAWARTQAQAEGELASAYSKLEAAAARLALLHHVVTLVDLGVDDLRDVSVASVEAGITLTRWFAGETRRLYGALADGDDTRALRRLADYVRSRGNRITARELMRSNCRRYPDSATAESALAELVDAGMAVWVEVPTRSGGLPVKSVELCMTHDTDDTDDTAPEGERTEAHDTEVERMTPLPDPWDGVDAAIPP